MPIVCGWLGNLGFLKPTKDTVVIYQLSGRPTLKNTLHYIPFIKMDVVLSKTQTSIWDYILIRKPFTEVMNQVSSRFFRNLLSILYRFWSSQKSPSPFGNEEKKCMFKAVLGRKPESSSFLHMLCHKTNLNVKVWDGITVHICGLEHLSTRDVKLF